MLPAPDDKLDLVRELSKTSHTVTSPLPEFAKQGKRNPA
jgi:hypothetical protein